MVRDAWLELYGYEEGFQWKNEGKKISLVQSSCFVLAVVSERSGKVGFKRIVFSVVAQISFSDAVHGVLQIRNK